MDPDIGIPMEWRNNVKEQNGEGELFDGIALNIKIPQQTIKKRKTSPFIVLPHLADAPVFYILLRSVC